MRVDGGNEYTSTPHTDSPARKPSPCRRFGSNNCSTAVQQACANVVATLRNERYHNRTLLLGGNEGRKSWQLHLVAFSSQKKVAN